MNELLSSEEVAALMRALLPIDGDQVPSMEDIGTVIDYALRSRIGMTLTDMAISGSVRIKVESDGELRFILVGDGRDDSTRNVVPLRRSPRSAASPREDPRETPPR